MTLNHATTSRRPVLATLAIMAALVLSLFAGSSSASAAGYKSYGPVYKSYSQCDKARKAYKSSWTSTSTCFKQMRVRSNGTTYWNGEYSFWIYYRY